MKLFKTNSMETVKACQKSKIFLDFELPSIQLEKRKKDLKQNLCPMECHTLCGVVYLVKIS